MPCPRVVQTIIAMTANAFAEDKARCFDAGMDDFIGKPIDPESFFATLLKWFEESAETLPNRPSGRRMVRGRSGTRRHANPKRRRWQRRRSAQAQD